MSKIVLTPEGTLHFPRLFEPEEFMGKRSYNTKIIFDEDVTPETGLKGILQALKDAAQERWGQHLPAGVGQKVPLRREEDGLWSIRTRRDAELPPPDVWNRDRTRIGPDDAHLIYGGVRARLALKVHAYDYKGSRGVTLLLEAVQRVADGERLGEGQDSRGYFDSLDTADEAPKTSANIKAPTPEPTPDPFNELFS